MDKNIKSNWDLWFFSDGTIFENANSYDRRRFTGIAQFDDHLLHVKDGWRHRDDGPALEHHDSSRNEWWLNGVKFTGINGWARMMEIYDTEEFIMMKLRYG